MALQTARGSSIAGKKADRDEVRPTRLDMSISIKNFGPISKGEIDLKPLTIFIGPTNTGKSYAAMLVHSIVTAENLALPIPKAYGNEHPKIVFLVYKKFNAMVAQAVKKYQKDHRVDVFMKFGDRVSSYLVQDLFKNALENLLTDNFGTKMRGLIRHGTKSSEILVTGANKFSVSITNDMVVKRNEKMPLNNDERDQLQNHIKNMLDRLSEAHLTSNTKNDERFIAESILHDLVDTITKSARAGRIPPISSYFPAGRTGLIQAFRVIATRVIHNVDVTKKDTKRLMLTGIVSRFIADLLRLEKERGHFYDLASKMELDILGGRVTLVENSGRLIPEIYYWSSKKPILLHRTSSTITEMAPLSLHLKHAAVSGSLLIIEEPEAHLHPANQALLAKYIVKMIREGLNVVVTTHSYILLEEIGTYMKSSGITDHNVRKKLGFESGDYLQFDEVAPYIFKRISKSECIIKDIKTDKADGIPQHEFVDMLGELYDRSTDLDAELDGS